MKYGFFPRTMWLVFRGSFQRYLPLIAHQNSGALMRKAKRTYRTILSTIPEFDKDDRFLVNLLSASMLAASLSQFTEKAGSLRYDNLLS